jgi:GDPmannose 4,6-dehydratase
MLPTQHKASSLSGKVLGRNSERSAARTGKTLVAVDEAYFRPSEVPALIGDARKAAKKLGWVPVSDWRRLSRKWSHRTSIERKRYHWH